MRYLDFLCAVALTASLSACGGSDDEPGGGVIVDPVDSSEVLYVVNAGQFNYSNASISRWTENSDDVVNDLFYRANGFKLGDTAQSAVVHGAQTWIVVNNSNVIFAVDYETFREVGRVDKKLISPRYIHFVSNDKAYVSQMGCDSIAIVNTKSYTVSGMIGIPEYDSKGGSAEEFVQIGEFTYVNLWSYGNRILKIDTRADKVVGELKTGVQPYSIVKDKNNDIWAICDGGGWDQNPVGYEAPTLLCIDPEEMKVKKSFSMNLGDNISKLSVNEDRSAIYWICNRYDGEGKNVGGVYRMSVDAASLPESPLIEGGVRNFYSMTVSPKHEDIFVADPLDYSQPGILYHYSSEGTLKRLYHVGVIPTSYAWYLR